MKKRNVIAMLFATLLVGLSSCAKSDEIENISSSSSDKYVTVAFSTAMTDQANRSRSAATSLTDVNKLTILAYQLDSKTGQYTYTEPIDSDNTDNEEKATPADNTPDFNAELKLPIGTYKFVAFYNAEEGTLHYPTVSANWDEIKSDIYISHTSENLDINEIFATSSEDDTDLSAKQGTAGNIITVELLLNRVNTRIDFLFKKVYKKDAGSAEVEQQFGTNNSIFGPGTAAPDAPIITSIETKAKVASRWTWPAGSAGVSLTGEKTFLQTNTKANITIGTSSGNTDNNPYTAAYEADPSKIKQGAALYKGAYILPFAGDTEKTGPITLTIKPAENIITDNEKPRIITIPGISAIKNKVTLVTLTLQASGEDEDDEEHLFSPEIQCKVSVNGAWGEGGPTSGGSVGI